MGNFRTKFWLYGTFDRYGFFLIDGEGLVNLGPGPGPNSLLVISNL